MKDYHINIFYSAEDSPPHDKTEEVKFCAIR